jgi:TonB family protein
MLSIHRLIFFTIAAGLILALFCLLLARTTHASRNPQEPQRAEDHSPAYAEGVKALSDANYERAAELFQQAAADKPADIWAFHFLGLSLLKLKRFDGAAKAYQQAMLIKPDDEIIHYQLGKIYIENGDLSAARKEQSRLQEQNPELALYLSDLFPQDNPASQQTEEAIGTPTKSQPADKSMLGMSAGLRPTILYREKAKYTEIARLNLTSGTVVLQVVFDVSGEIRDIRVKRKLPDGLTHKAIEAAQKIRFNPAIKNGEPVSVRGTLEFTFNLY